MGRKGLLTIAGMTGAEVRRIVEMGASMKRDRRSPALAGKSVALLFEKPSLRTYLSFDLAVHQLGGHAISLGRQEVRLGEREPVADVARVLSRYVEGIVLRTHAHATQEEMARHASVPVINALSDLEHPCQALGDMLTILEFKGRLEGQTVAYIGDGNNVATSLALACSLVGISFRIASPPGYGLPDGVVALARRNGGLDGATVQRMEDPREAVQGADVVYTDVWVSMGQEEERERTIRVIGKNSKEREVAVGKKAIEALERYLRKRRTRDRYLFLASGGYPMTVNGLRMALARRFAAASVEFRGVHAFRRGWASAYLSNGGDAGDLRHLGGWEGFGMVARYARGTEAQRALKGHAKASPADHLNLR